MYLNLSRIIHTSNLNVCFSNQSILYCSHTNLDMIFKSCKNKNLIHTHNTITFHFLLNSIFRCILKRYDIYYKTDVSDFQIVNQF